MDDGELSKTMTAAAYSEAVYQWMLQVHQWRSFAAGFPAHLAYQSTLAGNQQPRSAQNAQASGASPDASQQTQRLTWREFKIPSLWKRAFAGFLDFLIVRVITFLLTHAYFELFQVDPIFKADANLAFVPTLNFSVDVLLFELVSMLISIVFEAVCTCVRPRGSLGGATPGKVLMGIRILSCEQVVLTGDCLVQVTPADSIGTSKAVVRSVVKNAISVLLPSWIPALLSPHRRAAQDALAKTIVVEDP